MRNERFTAFRGSVVPGVGRSLVAECAHERADAAARSLSSVAEQYVKLVLAVGQHDADYVDAFYGPPEWRKEAEAAKKPLAEIDAQAAAVETAARRSCRSPPRQRTRRRDCGRCAGSI